MTSENQVQDLLGFPFADSLGTCAPTSLDCYTSQSLYTYQFVVLHLCDFLINVWHLPPKTGSSARAGST